MNKELINRPEHECACTQCVKMCKHSPCFPTPKDVVDLIEAGLKDKLQYTVWLDIETGKWYDLIAPKGFKAFEDNEFAIQCVFLNSNDKCDLHNAQLKPTEGKLMLHDMDNSVQIRREVLKSWDTEEGFLMLMHYYPLDTLATIYRMKNFPNMTRGYEFDPSKSEKLKNLYSNDINK